MALATGAGLEPTMCESKSHVFPITPTRRAETCLLVTSLRAKDTPYPLFIVDYGYHSTQKHYNILVGILKRGVLVPLTT